MDRKDHAAPPDDGHQGSYTVPSDVVVPGEPEGTTANLPQPEQPRLHTDPQRPEGASRSVDVKAVLAGLGVAVVLAAIVFFTFFTSAPQ